MSIEPPDSSESAGTGPSHNGAESNAARDADVDASAAAWEADMDAARRSDAAWDADVDAAAAAAPDALGHVVEVAEMMAVFAAQRFVAVHAMRCEALAEAERFGRGLAEVVDRSTRLELSAALRITEHAAGMLIGRAEALVTRYPAVLDSLARASITVQHAEILIDALDAIEPDLRRHLLAQALPVAELQPVGSFRRILQKLIETARAATLAERHTAALQARRVVVEPADDGMAWLSMLIPAVEAHAGYGRLTAIAKVLGAVADETRTRDQLRADILCDLLIDGDTDTHPAEARGIRAIVTVTVPALALLDQPSPSSGMPVMEGVGPIPIGRARELCGNADGWMRVLTHPETSAVLSVGRDQYRPPPALRRLVRWRAGRCMAPGCGVPAARCEIDHTTAWEHGGPTALDNLAPLCKGHHTVKHHGGWHVRQVHGSGGTIEWTSPTGRRYVVEPERRVPAFHPAPISEPAPF